MRHTSRLLAAATLSLAALLSASAAHASPWLLAPGEIAVIGRWDLESADEEFLDDEGESQPFPLRGRYRASTFTTGVRYGVVEGWEIELSIPIRNITYTSDPVILLPTDTAGQEALDFYQDNIIDLSRSVVGVGDVQLAGRYQLFRGVVPTALELRLKTPTGYGSPAGTFGERPESREDFIQNIGTYVRPENVTDDVTLGDGQLDLSPGLLVGWAASTGTFARLDTAYRLRFGGAGDQIAASARVGQLFRERVLLYGGVDFEMAVQKGRVIGISVAAIDPTLPASEYESTDNLNLREVTLDRDRLVVAGGAILRLTPEVELNLGYGHTVWGRNTAVTQVFSVGLGLRTSLWDTE